LGVAVAALLLWALVVLPAVLPQAPSEQPIAIAQHDTMARVLQRLLIKVAKLARRIVVILPLVWLLSL
jgi:hypothetical protein